MPRKNVRKYKRNVLMPPGHPIILLMAAVSVNRSIHSRTNHERGKVQHFHVQTVTVYLMQTGFSQYSQTSLIRTQKEQSQVSVSERFPFKRGHYDDVTFDSTYSFKWSVAKTRLTLVFRLHLNLLIHSTKTLSFLHTTLYISATK